MAYQPLTREQFNAARKSGFTPDQIVANEKRRKASSSTVSVGADTSKFKTDSWTNGNLVKAGEAARDFVVGAGKGAGSTLAGMSELGQRTLGRVAEAGARGLGKLFGTKAATAPSSIDQSLKSTQEFKDDHLAPTNTAQRAGFATEQIGEFFVPIPGGAKVGVAQKTLAKAKTLGEALSRAARFGGKALAEGVDAGARTAMQRGRIDGETADAAKLGIASPFIGAAASATVGKLKNALFSSAVPSTITQRAKDAMRGLNIGEGIADTGFSLTRGSLTKKVQDKASHLGSGVDEVIDSYTKANPLKVKKIDDIADSVASQLTDDFMIKKMKISPVDVPQAREAVAARLESYRKMYGDKALKLSEIQKLKVDLGDGLKSVYDKAIDAPMKAKALTDMKVQDKLRSIVADEVPGADALNKLLAPVIEGRNRLQAKGKYSGLLTDVIAGSFSAGDASSFFEDPAGYFKRFASGVLVKRLGTSTAAKTGTGTAMKYIEDIANNPAFAQLVRKILSEKPVQQTE